MVEQGLEQVAPNVCMKQNTATARLKQCSHSKAGGMPSIISIIAPSTVAQAC